MKWSGSKDSQATEIISNFPKNIINYYEPFIGGGSVFLKLLEESNIENFYISDYNIDLINIYILIKKDPSYLISTYYKHYKIFNDGDYGQRKEYFKKIRNRYNIERNPSDFYWIMRTTTNGMPRYNKKNEFNNSCHFTRPGMSPDKVEKLINKYSKLFNSKNVVFEHYDYININIKHNSFIYCDPPYENTKGMYFSTFNNAEFLVWLNMQHMWMLSYDGKINNNEVKHNKPIYKKHKYLKSGNSSFRRVIGNSKNSIIYESIYMNY